MSEEQADDRSGLSAALEGSERGEERPRSTDDELIGRAADGEKLGAVEQDALTAYFLGDRRARPGETPQDEKEFDVEIGPTGTDAELWRIKCAPITWDQWQAAQKLGVKRERGVDELEALKRASYVCAYGIVKPDLGEVRMGIDSDVRPADTAQMLRDFFRKNPGVILQLETEILRLSRLAINESAIREVSAGKS
jgi:hypothetical protein